MKFPETFRKAQQFQGAFIYYLRQTPYLSALMSPLSEKIAKGKKYQLTEEIISNLTTLREKIKDGGRRRSLQKFVTVTKNCYHYKNFVTVTKI
jgi:hypothetical protein